MIAKTREDKERTVEELRAVLLDALHKSGLTQAEVARRLGTQMARHYSYKEMQAAAGRRRGDENGKNLHAAKMIVR